MLQTSLAQLSLLKTSIVTGIFLVIYCLYARWHTTSKLKKLGERAPEVRSSLPFAIDFIYRYVAASAKNEEISFFASCISSAMSETSSQAVDLTSKRRIMTAELNSGISDRMVLTGDSTNIKALLSDVSSYGKGKRFHEVWEEFIGDSIFAVDGELWEKTRAKMKPIFFRDNVVDLAIFEDHSALLIKHLSNRWDPAQQPDVVDLFLRYTLDVATDFLFGEGTDCLTYPQSRVDEAFRYILQRQSDLDNMDDFSWLLSRTKFRQELKILDDFVYPYVHRSLALTRTQLEAKISSRDNLLNSLTLYTRDAKFLRDQMITILLAGRDTTAMTMAFVFFELSRNPKVFEALRKEIVGRLGEGDDAVKPNVKDLKELKMLNAVIDETFRMYPAVPLNFRSALKDATLPTGGGEDGTKPIGILKGTKILFSIILVHKNPDLYPAIAGVPSYDPTKWIPTRWLNTDDSKRGWTPELWNFLPFHHGRRACPGQKLAQVEIAYTVTRILQSFRAVTVLGWEGPEGKARDLKCKVAVTMSPAEELRCVFEPLK